jgi:hypothetical protein
MGRKVIKVAKSTAIVVEPFKNDHGNYIGVREFYKPRDNEDADWLPTRNGFSVPVQDGEDGKDFVAKIAKAMKWAQENFEDEHKVLESKDKAKSKGKDKDKAKGKKKKREDDDD